MPHSLLQLLAKKKNLLCCLMSFTIAGFTPQVIAGDMPRGKVISTDPRSPHVESGNNAGYFIIIKPGDCYPTLKKGMILPFNNVPVTVPGRLRGVFEYYDKVKKDGTHKYKLKHRSFVTRHGFQCDTVNKKITLIGSYQCPK